MSPAPSMPPLDGGEEKEINRERRVLGSGL
jgi:hypothetical protein